MNVQLQPRALAVPLFVAALALGFLPGAGFFLPKLMLLAAGAVGFSLWALARGQPAPRLPLVLALVFFGLTCSSALRDPAPGALLLDAAAALLLIALLRLRWSGAAALRGLALAGGLLAAVVIAQWLLPGPRLRMFGTLGNPDFCAAWLVPSFCAALPWRDRRGLVLAALQGVALACIGSFATVLALLAAALLLARPRLALGAAAAGALCLAAAGRDPVRALEGRLYLHRICAPHLLDAPLPGLGKGSVRALWPRWEADRWASGAEPETARRFAAAQDHVHDDWLERALEDGWPSALVLLLLAALSIRRARARPEFAAAGAGLAALAARALVDFPLARPAELSLFVVLLALPYQES